MSAMMMPYTVSPSIATPARRAAMLSTNSVHDAHGISALCVSVTWRPDLLWIS